MQPYFGVIAWVGRGVALVSGGRDAIHRAELQGRQLSEEASDDVSLTPSKTEPAIQPERLHDADCYRSCLLAGCDP
jgi:hypothetical protein